MNDQATEMLARQQQREVARRARAHRPVDRGSDPAVTEARVRRPRRMRSLGLRLAARLSRA